jgi:hypothetical protein
MEVFLLYLSGLLILLLQLPAVKFGPDWINRKTIIPSSVLLFILITGFVYLSRKIKLSLTLWRLLVVTAIILFLISTGFYFLEFSHFDNYVFSAFHLIPWQVAVIFGSLAALIAITRLKNSKMGLIGLVSFYFLFSYSFALLSQVSGQSLARIPQAITNLSRTNDAKLTSVYGRDYDFIKFLNKGIPVDGKILIPPNTLPWRHTGDFYLMQAFLYPHHINTASQDWIFSREKVSDFDYVVISSEEGGNPGDPYQIWPDFPIPSAKIVIYNFDSGLPEIKNNMDYRPEDWVGIKAWGYLIPKKI